MIPTATNELAEYVDHGAKLLDRWIPGWAQSINTDKLDLLSHCNCILGQLYGDYEDGLFELSPLDGDTAFYYGFTLNKIYFTDPNKPWSELKQLWIEAIEMRRNGK